MKLFFFSLLFVIHLGYAQRNGCTDSMAINYNTRATINDGSCQYQDTIITPTFSTPLPEKLLETSGLILWDNELYSQNDSGDINLYKIDSETGAIQESYPLIGAKNTDWEGLAQDENYIYVGDFGNNLSGNRSDLNILRIEKKSLLQKTPKIEKINFEYEDQSDFSAVAANTTDYDCEALIVTKDSIYLFTKQWTGQKSAVYTLPKTPGDHVALKKSTIEVNGLITGAVNIEDKNLVTLCGYSPALEPFIYVIYDFKAHNFLKGNKRKFRLELPFHQVEGITTGDGLNYFISNEKFTRPPFINAPQRLHKLDLSAYLGDYIEERTLDFEQAKEPTGFILYPQPTNGILNIKNLPEQSLPYRLFATNGNMLLNGTLNHQRAHIDLSIFSAGIYLLKFYTLNDQNYRVIKR